MPVAHLNGTDLFYVEVGEGPPCLVMHERMPNSELTVFEKSGHFAHVEEPEAFLDAARRWLKHT